MPNIIEIEETFCRQTDGRMYVRMYGRTFNTGFTRSTLLKSWPNNVQVSSTTKLQTADKVWVVLLGYLKLRFQTFYKPSLTSTRALGLRRICRHRLHTILSWNT